MQEDSQSWLKIDKNIARDIKKFVRIKISWKAFLSFSWRFGATESGFILLIVKNEHQRILLLLLLIIIIIIIINIIIFITIIIIKKNWSCAMTRHHADANINILLTRNLPFDFVRSHALSSCCSIICLPFQVVQIKQVYCKMSTKNLNNHK